MLDVVVRRASGRRRGRLHILTAHVADETGEIRATWFNQPWLEAKLAPGTRVRLRGKQNRFGFQVSSYDLGEAVETADFAPVYPSTADLAQKTLRTLTEAALALARDAGEPLPAAVRATRRAAAPSGRARRAPSAAHGGRRRAGAPPPRARRAPDAPARAPPPGTRSGRRSSRSRCRRPAELVARYRDVAAVHAHRRAGAGDRRDRRRPGAHRRRCSACSRATSARGRRPSRSTRCSARSRPAARAR